MLISLGSFSFQLQTNISLIMFQLDVNLTRNVGGENLEDHLSFISHHSYLKYLVFRVLQCTNPALIFSVLLHDKSHVAEATHSDEMLIPLQCCRFRPWCHTNDITTDFFNCNLAATNTVICAVRLVAQHAMPPWQLCHFSCKM